MKDSSSVTPAICRIVLLCLLFLLGSVACQADDNPLAAKEPAAQILSLVEMYGISSTLSKELTDLRKKVAKTTEVISPLDGLPGLVSELESLTREASRAAANPHVSYHQVLSLESRLVKLNLQLQALSIPVTAHLKGLETRYRQWLEKQSLYKKLRMQANEQPGLDSSLKTVESLGEVINTGKNLIAQHIQQTILAGEKIGEVLTRVYELKDTVSSLMENIRGLSLSQTSPSMLSAAFF